MIKKSSMLGIRLTPKIREIVKKLAVSQGMNESEYVRSLIYKELEKLSIFSTNISKAKKEIFEEEEGEADVYKGD